MKSEDKKYFNVSINTQESAEEWLILAISGEGWKMKKEK